MKFSTQLVFVGILIYSLLVVIIRSSELPLPLEFVATTFSLLVGFFFTGMGLFIKWNNLDDYLIEQAKLRLKEMEKQKKKGK